MKRIYNLRDIVILKFLIIPLILLLPAIFYAGNNVNSQLKPLKSNLPPLIDGKLDDKIWEEAPTVNGFKTFLPDYGFDMSQKTVVYMAYDKSNLYFAYECFDTEPERIKASITNRDNISSDDWICLNLDTFNDQQSLYAFYVNPYGIQMDSRYSNNNEDLSFDAVWYSAGRINKTGYAIEIQIPLKSIRYSDDNPVKMALFFERSISRTSEQGSYPEFDPAKGFAMMTQLKEIIYNDLEHFNLLEILPAFTYHQVYSDSQGSLFKTKDEGEFSLTAKYGLTSKLIIDGTYNPDFSQIEADAGQVDINLRYDLFFPEKRPFFLEGSEIYKLSATAVNEVDPVRSIVHTRNIVNPLAGTKLTGKLNQNTTVALLYAADELENRRTEENNKYAHFGIFRFKYSLDEDSYLGGIYTSRELKMSYNRVAGLDGMFRLTESSTLEYSGLLSYTKNDFNPSTKGEYTLGLSYARATRDLDYKFAFRDISRNFNVETGYGYRTGLIGGSGLIRPKIFPKSSFFRRFDLEFFSAQNKDRFANKWETFNHFSVNSILPGDMLLKIKYSYSTEIYLGERFKTGGFHVFGGGWFTSEIYLGVLYRRIGAVYYSDSPYQGKSNRITSSLMILPSDKIETVVDFIFYDFYRESDNQLIYEYPITRFKLTYQLNQYLFVRGLVEYNNYRKSLLTDFLVSFTYIPGTVFHIGNGSFYEKIRWETSRYIANDDFIPTKRGLFLKFSYLWRS